MQENNITYLIGAGASANVIPTVANISRRLEELDIHLERVLNDIVTRKNTSFYPETIYTQSIQIKNIKTRLNWMRIEASNHQTIDTLAKKYYLTGEFENLKNLKIALSLFFKIEQVLSIPSFPRNDYTFDKKEEKRYDSFIASVLQKSGDEIFFPKNIKFLSWNYDLQFELAAQRYFNEFNLSKLRIELQSIPNIATYDRVEGQVLDCNKFGLVKINGCAVWDNSSIHTAQENPQTLFDEVNKVKSVDETSREYYQNVLFCNLIEQYTKTFPNDTFDNSLKYFNFSWEDDPNFKYKYGGHANNLMAAQSIAEQTTILVVIGYSFPVFNRKIDTTLINSMNNLQKVYVQDLNPEQIVQTIKSAFKRFQVPSSKTYPEIEFAQDNNLNQFILPYEL